MPTKEMVNIMIDGKSVEAPKGENLLKVILDNKVSVPHYCYHPGLSVAGACRMCVIEVEKAPRPMIACNMKVQEGMSVKTNTDTVKATQKWNLAFHLINHPLDCPICDQAGECGLQDYYMKYGKYESDMREPKVLKRKVISIGKEVMLDTERCILCSRCVRFFDEVPKTAEMAIFNRGDHSEIGTFQDKDLHNNYTLNSVDICPVGALTSKDFRFKKRVWFLKSVDSVCPGCSTGCNIKVDEDPKERQTYRILPRFNADVNGYWMCDYGRKRYKPTNPENRIQSPLKKGTKDLKPIDWPEAQRFLSEAFKTPPEQIGVLVTPQYTSEELKTIYDFFDNQIGTKNIFHTVNEKEVADQNVTDELLLRKDKNPNSNGLLQIAKEHSLNNNKIDDFKKELAGVKWKTLFIFSPEDPDSHPHFLDIFKQASRFLEKRILVGTQTQHATPFFDLALPTLSFVEKKGTFMNFQKRNQPINAGVKLVEQAKPLSEILCL